MIHILKWSLRCGRGNRHEWVCWRVEEEKVVESKLCHHSADVRITVLGLSSPAGLHTTSLPTAFSSCLQAGARQSVQIVTANSTLQVPFSATSIIHIRRVPDGSSPQIHSQPPLPVRFRTILKHLRTLRSHHRVTSLAGDQVSWTTFIQTSLLGTVLEISTIHLCQRKNGN